MKHLATKIKLDIKDEVDKSTFKISLPKPINLKSFSSSDETSLRLSFNVLWILIC